MLLVQMACMRGEMIVALLRLFLARTTIGYDLLLMRLKLPYNIEPHLVGVVEWRVSDQFCNLIIHYSLIGYELGICCHTCGSRVVAGHF